MMAGKWDDAEGKENNFTRAPRSREAGAYFCRFCPVPVTFLGFEGKPAGYFIMFCFCGVAYLIAWCIMKSLVPKYKPITLE